jgi:putative transcription factor
MVFKQNKYIFNK